MIKKINYADKTVGGKFTASDANEIKTSINSNADVLYENSQFILSLQGGSLGSIKPTDAAPTPARNGNYTFSIGGNKPAWLTAEAGITEVKAGDDVAVVFTAPSNYSYTHVDTGSSIEQVRSQNASKVPSSKLFDDEVLLLDKIVGGTINTEKISFVYGEYILSTTGIGYDNEYARTEFNKINVENAKSISFYNAVNKTGACIVFVDIEIMPVGAIDLSTLPQGLTTINVPHGSVYAALSVKKSNLVELNLSIENNKEILYRKIEWEDNYVSRANYIKRISFRANNDTDEWEFLGLTQDPVNYFYVAIKNTTTNTKYILEKSFEVRPTSPIIINQWDRQYLNPYPGDAIELDALQIDIDFTNAPIFVDPLTTNMGKFVVGNTNNFKDSVFNNELLDGCYVLDEDIFIPDGIHIYGHDCVVSVEGGSITLGANAGLHNIKFVGTWDINRTPAVDTRHAEAGFEPSLTMTQIKSAIVNYPSDYPTILGTYILIKTKENSRHQTESQNSCIDGCSFEKIGGVCIQLNSGRHQSDQHPYVSDCYFSKCMTAIWMNGEFERVINSMIDNCYFGIVLNSGNSNICNSFIKRCDCNIIIWNNGNGLHGQMSNCEIAHSLQCGMYITSRYNTTTSDQPNLGYLFSNCQWADASIESDYVTSLMFNGCRMETWFNISDGAKNSIHSSIFSKAYAIAYGIADWLHFPSDTSMKLNRGIADCSDYDVNN